MKRQCSRTLVQSSKTTTVSLIDFLSVSFLFKLAVEDRKQYCLKCCQFVDLVTKATPKEECREFRMGGYTFVKNSLG